MFEYKCPHCGWVIKSQIIFEGKKPCLNCDGFVELQAAQQNVERTGKVVQVVGVVTEMSGKA